MLVLQSILLSMGINTFGLLKYIVEQCLYSCGVIDSKEKYKIQIVSQEICVTSSYENRLRFWPPLHIQRYTAVQEIIGHPIWKESIKKVVEFGCAELNFFPYLKSIPQITNVMLVDIDINALEIYNGKVMPTNYDYLMSANRKQPLEVNIYEGSIADLDDRLLGMDAVIGIELIEHLYPNVLDKVPITVFGFIKPKLAVFTTPNKEYNVLFPNSTQKFRHYDHKFEWSRKEMKEWANNIITNYPEYTVEFDGIGPVPTGTEEFGCCSQVAIFYRKDMEASPANLTGFKPYKLLKTVNYPYEPPNEKHEIIIMKLRLFVSENSANKEFIVNGQLKIPLRLIMPLVSDYCTCIKELEYITSKEYRTAINKAGEWVLVKDLAETRSKEYDSDSDSSLNSSEEENWLLDNNFKEVEEENWLLDTDVKEVEEENWLLDNDVKEVEEEEEEEWSVPANMGSSNSKLCYSTLIAKDKHMDVTFLNSLTDTYTKSKNSTTSSNSDFFTTDIDNNDTNNEKMKITVIGNGSIDDNNTNNEDMEISSSSIDDNDSHNEYQCMFEK